MRNQFCKWSDLRNEAGVEQNFVRRLLENLGYSDAEIRPKQSLEASVVGGMRGHPRRNYKPDFGVYENNVIRWIVEAKAPGESLDDHEWQPRAYVMILNGTDAGRLVDYYLLTNGDETRIYTWERNAPVLSLQFSDFSGGNEKFSELRKLLGRAAMGAREEPRSQRNLFRMNKLALAEVNSAFAWCHQHIYKKDNISQSDAFTEFVKLISLKLMSDRRIRDVHPEIMERPFIELPPEEVQFSMHFVLANESHTTSPINDILFRSFMLEMERDIATRRRKRIFEANDQIRLRPETIRGVVRRLESIFLFGIDADLNGRLFETFLNATMRGKDLGQFFTPRSLIKLGIGLAQIKVRAPLEGGGYHTDTIVDACCGSGGFLIDALADMWAKADRMNLPPTEKAALKLNIANSRIVGCDIANAPKLARIARLNMYLHGDGGTRIYHLNALDKAVRDRASDDVDTTQEKHELRELLTEPMFDVALTNPPFAKAVDRTTDEERLLLDAYTIGKDKSSVRSNLLFLERYYDILKPGGRLVTIIDDGILSADDYAWFRERLREWFIIKAVVSLPGDAFQRSNARVKTSYLVAEKRVADLNQPQPAVFMYPCQHVGLDDPKRQRARAGDVQLRRAADLEIARVKAEYERFLAGQSDTYRVPPERMAGRLDVKNCLVAPGRRVADWRAAGFDVLPLSSLLEEREFTDEEIITKDYTEPVRVAVVRYEGVAEEAERVYPAESSFNKLFPISEGDIVISNIAASHGSIAVVPPDLDGCAVSNEYTILRCKPGYDPTVMQLVLRSPEVRADILLTSSGANRTRARWAAVRDIMVPYPAEELIDSVRKLTEKAEESLQAAKAFREQARMTVEQTLSLVSTDADTILAAFRPPN